MRLFYPSIHTRDRQHRLKQWKQKLSFFRTRHPSGGSKRFCPTKEWCQRWPSARSWAPLRGSFSIFYASQGSESGKRPRPSCPKCHHWIWIPSCPSCSRSLLRTHSSQPRRSVYAIDATLFAAKSSSFSATLPSPPTSVTSVTFQRRCRSSRKPIRRKRRLR